MPSTDADIWRPRMLIHRPSSKPSHAVWSPQDNREVLDHLAKFPRKPVKILNEVSAKYGIARAILLGKQHSDRVFKARSELYCRLSIEMRWTHAEVGAFAKRSPPSVREGIKRFFEAGERRAA